MMSLISFFEISEHSSRWLEVLFAASVKGFVVLAMAAGLNLVLRRSSSSLRHLIWLLAITSCLCLPVISVILPSWQLPVVPQMHTLPDATPGLEKHLGGSELPLSEHGTIAPQASIPEIHQNREPAKIRNVGQGVSHTENVQAAGWWTIARTLDLYRNCLVHRNAVCPRSTGGRVGRHLENRTTKSARYHWLVGGVDE